MAGFEKQPNSLSRSRSRTESRNMDDTLSDISLSDLSMREGMHPREAFETYRRLQSDYDELLTKYAQAENTIDQLRIGAKLNLYSDLPPPQQSKVVNVSQGKQPQVFRFPKAGKASLSQPSHNNGTQGTSTKRLDLLNKTPDREALLESTLLTPKIRADGIRTALMFKLPTLQENVEDLQGHVTDGDWGENELKELKDICNQLMKQHHEMKDELMRAKELEGQGIEPGQNESFEGDFLHEDGLEGQLYRLGLRLDEINEQIEENLNHIPRNNINGDDSMHRSVSVQDQSVRRKDTDPELAALLNRLRSVKESAANDQAVPRSGDRTPDSAHRVNHVQNGHREDDLTLGPLTDDSDEEDDRDNKHNASHGGVDLQESGYYASETMSVFVGDANPEPLSAHYLSNSAGGAQHPLRGRDRASFDRQSEDFSPERQRPHSDTSVDSSPHRSRKTKQRSRASTMDNHVTYPLTSYPDYISPTSPPDIERTHPQASSSILTEQTRHQPHVHDDSRFSQSSGKRSRAGTSDSRFSKDPVDPNSRNDGTGVDILRTEHDTPDQYTCRTRSSIADDIPPAESLESSPRVLDSKKTGQRKPGHQRTSMSSADSRVSTPLFHPGARPKDTRRGRDKIRPLTAETERGFDSGFFGSEESRGSRLTHTAHDPSKLRHPSLREQTLSESEEERFNLPPTQTPVRSASKSRDQRRRRPYLKSLSESDEERGLETSPSKTSLRSTANQRERRGHRHTPTFPATRSDNERIRRPDDSLRRPSSSPNLFDEPELRRSTRTLRPDSLRKSTTEAEHPTRIGPRSDHDPRPMDKQSIRSYPGMDRESVRSGRRSRRDDDSSSAYSDGARKYKRDPVDKLREELQRMRTQLQEEANARTFQAQMYDDLRRKHDDLEREIARKNAEQQMTSMYEGLRKKYDDLSKSVEQPRDSPQREVGDDLKRRLDELAMEVKGMKSKGSEANGTVRFLCPFCGGCGDHHHGSYYYPGLSGHRGTEQPGTPRGLHEAGTQTIEDRAGQYSRYPATPQATSTPYYNGVLSSPAYHYHTNTYPGGVSPGLPIHHIHHLPDSRSRDHRVDNDDDDYATSDEDNYYRPKRRSSSQYRRRGRESHHDGELDSRRLHLSLDEANRAARRVQRISKRMLNSVASDLIRSGQR